MTAIRVAESLAYGVKMCLYWLAVVVAGGGGVVLGGALAWPEVQSWRSNGAISTPELAGGAVLAFLGLFVLVSGLFGIVYKLLADSVADGNAASSDSIAEAAESEMESHTTAPAEQATDQQTASQPRGDQTPRRPGTSEGAAGGGAIAEAAESDTTTGIEDETEQSVAQPGDEETVWEGDWEEKPASASGTEDSPAEQAPAESQAGDDENRSQPSGEQRQPSAEEIAFGSAPPETDDEPTDAESTAPDTQGEPTTTETAGDPSSDPLADRLSDDN